MMRAWWTLPLALLGPAGCAAPEVWPAPILKGNLRLESARSFALLRWLEQTPADATPPAELDLLIGGLAFLADQSREQAAAGLRAAVASSLEEARSSTEAVVSVLEARSDVIRARVARLIPEEAADGPPLFVVAALGLPPGQPLGLVHWDGYRALMIDSLALGREAGGGSGPVDRDALGQRLLLAITPELFHVRFEHYRERSRAGRIAARPDDQRLLERLLNEGVADFLRMPPEARFDTRGRRSPVHDVTARRALLQFTENLAELNADETTPGRRQRLLWSFANGPRLDRWGTFAGALMVDAILRFGPPGRMRAVLRNDPLDLITAYREICGREAAVPVLEAGTAALLRDIYARKVRP